jgi:hypothetical protein
MGCTSGNSSAANGKRTSWPRLVAIEHFDHKGLAFWGALPAADDNPLAALDSHSNARSQAEGGEPPAADRIRGGVGAAGRERRRGGGPSRNNAFCRRRVTMRLAILGYVAVSGLSLSSFWGPGISGAWTPPIQTTRGQSTFPTRSTACSSSSLAVPPRRAPSLSAAWTRSWTT